jgi:hypothetical protein
MRKLVLSALVRNLSADTRDDRIASGLGVGRRAGVKILRTRPQYLVCSSESGA